MRKPKPKPKRYTLTVDIGERGQAILEALFHVHEGLDPAMMAGERGAAIRAGLELLARERLDEETRRKLPISVRRRY